ncbi:MAG: hypothetical protein AAGA33_05130 [Pseudomonadota bacterium]
MTGDTGEVSEDVEDLEENEDSEDRMIEDDDVVEATSEINVDEIVSKIDKQTDIDRQRAVRRRLDELSEQKLASKDIDSTYNISLDDDY